MCTPIPRLAQMLYLNVEATRPEDEMEVQIRCSVKGATVIQKLPSKFELNRNNSKYFPVGVILIGDESPVIKYQIFYQGKLIHAHVWQKKPEQVIKSKETIMEDHLFKELRKPAPDMSVVMECEEYLPADKFVAMVNKIAPGQSFRVLKTAYEYCHISNHLCKLVDQQL